MMKTDWTVVFRVAVVLLLGVMVACLLNLRCRIEYLEQEIVAVEQRAMEREMRLVSLPETETAAETVVSDCRVAALLAMTEEEKPILCSVEEVPVVCDTETATDTDTNCVPASVLATNVDAETYTDCVTQPPFDEDYVLRVLTAEAGCDPVLCGCVAQCLYNACERYDWVYSPAEMLVKYQYTGPCDWVSAEAERAFDEVFCSGVTWDCVGKATVFYAPRYGESAYHESQRFVVEIGGVRFFEEVE